VDLADKVAQGMDREVHTRKMPVADFDCVVNEYRSRVFRYALASLRDRDAADIVTQDCFIKAYRTWDTFRGDCSIETWLMQIAVNLVRDHLRNRQVHFWKRQRQLVDSHSTRMPTPEAQAALTERVAAVWDAATKLPQQQRTVFALRFKDDLDLLEIAAATGLKEGTVKTHLFRALKSVRWACAAIAACLLLMFFLPKPQRRPSDAELFRKIDLQLSQTAPTALQPLSFLLTGNQ
jgi:RNA polymerase sigma-70 factor (ECF subfamily)